VIQWPNAQRAGQTLTVNSTFPSVPITFLIDPREFEIVETPSAGNGWKKLVIRSTVDHPSGFTIPWTVER